MKQRLSLLWMLLLCFVAGAWADEESSGNQGTADAAIVGTSYSLDGKFIAGKGGRMQGNMPDKGVKLRTNKGAWVFAVNAGYRIDKFEFWGCSNDGNTVDIASATVDGGDNLLASAVTVPAKDGSTSADITLTDITARDNITLDFANGSSQIVGTWKITYTQEQVILQEITDVTLNGASIGETALATLKADKAVTIDGSSLNGIGILDVTLSSGATTVNRAFDGDNVVYTFTTNGGADAYTVTVTGVKKTYAAAQGTVVYYNEDALSNGKKTLTIDGVAFNYPSKQFGYANNTAGVTLGETTYKPIKLSTGEAVSVTFPEGKKVKKIIVYGWSAGGLGTGKLVNFTDGGEKSVDTSNDIFYANDGSGSVYPSVYEYEVDNWEALTFQGNGDQPFVVMDFVYAEEAPVTYAITKAVWPEGAATFTLDKETAAAGETVKITDIQLGAGFTSADFVTFGVQGESGNPVEMTMISDGGYPVSYNEIVAYEFVMPAEPVTVNMTFKEPTGTKATFDFVANKWGYPTVSSSMDREKAPLGTFEKDGAKVVFKRAGGNQGYYYNNGTLVEARMMNKNILKVIAPEGKAITKVVFTTSTQYNLAGDGLTEKTWTGNATRASFTAGGSCYFTQIDVTYDDVNAETADPEEADESIILDFSDPLAHDKRFNVTENEYLTEDIVVTDGPAEQGSRVKTTIKPVEGASTATQSYIRYSATGVTMYVRTGGKIVFEADGDKVIKNIKMTAAAFNATLNGEAVTKDQITGEGWNGNSSMVELVATGGTNITDITFTLGDKPVPVAAKYPIEAVVTPAEALTFDYSPKEAAAGEEVTVALSNLVFGEGYSSTDLLTATTSLKTEGGTDVEYTLDAATLSINFTMPAEKVIASLEFAPKTKDIVYDFAAAAAAGENPGNVNGGSANGAIFYGWENEGKTYSKRQDYKGYAWAEGSVLPEECHVWRRSDRINGNMTAADAEVLGLNCPAQREMAINGLSAGQQVVIEYTGEGEILYATGFDAANPTAEPNTVAVVGDGNKAAVSGTTTIASGTPIHIVSTDNGYFVFRVLKNMVIQKITISEESAPIDPASVVKPNIVSVSTEIANGTAKADKVQAFEGDEVTVTATPAEGYKLDAITVTGVNTDVAVEVTDGKFIMPNDDVTVSATFVELAKTVYDFAAAAAAGENPSNVNGGSANGAIFYGWENEGKTYSKRQDYKGYAWAEGSVLPEECHVWRRSDRINGNMTAADAEVLGLNCPAQREMAINGLSAGQQVVIEYTGEGEILYATGFDAANPTAEPNTVAVVGDGNKAAISGTTTIASGTPIHIVSTDNGYFVFRVLKNMVIQKITISEESAPIDPASVVKPNIVSVSTEIANGTAKADKVQAFEGDEVTVTATPAEGYELDAITVTGVNTNVAVEVTDGKFTMPADDVTISVTFKEATLTAISGINADASADDNDAPAYNLAGQKVGKNYKGIVIKNGKKVVMK